MIARIWHGRVPVEKHAKYLDFMQRVALPDYRATPGNRSARCLHRIDDDVVHFVMLTTWDNVDAIRAFAGDPVDTAKYYDFDRDYLLELEPKVQHFEISE